jgi:hypothetical protein
MTKYKQYFVKHLVNPISDDTTINNNLNLKPTKDKLFIFIPFKVNHNMFDSSELRKICGVFQFKEINSPTAIASELTLANKSKKRQSLNKMTLIISKLSKEDDKNSPLIKKRAQIVFSMGLTTKDLTNQIALLKTVTFEEKTNWTIDTIIGPKEQLRVKINETDNK